MNSEEEVMGNSDLRRLIWSYLRKNPKRECFFCNKVLVWDKKKLDLHFIIPILDDTVYVYECVECSLGSVSNPFQFGYNGGSIGYYKNEMM